MSAIVATHNRAGYLDDCLKALAHQVRTSAMHYEIVVVDNASTDDTARVIAESCRRDTRFRGIREDRLGKSIALNTALSRAAGELLLFTDDDVMVNPAWVVSWHEFFVDRPPALEIAGGPIFAIPSDLGPWPPWLGRDSMQELPYVDYGDDRALGSSEYVWGANFAARAHLFRELGPWDETVGPRGNERGTFEDKEYNRRVEAAGGARLFRHDIPVSHRVERHRINPRYLLATASARARHEYRQAHGAVDPLEDPSRLSAGVVIPGTVRLITGLIAWLCLTLLFRVRGGPEMFERCRRAAWRCGWIAESLRVERPGPVTGVVGRLASVARRVVLSLAPGDS